MPGTAFGLRFRIPEPGRTEWGREGVWSNRRCSCSSQWIHCLPLQGPLPRARQDQSGPTDLSPSLWVHVANGPGAVQSRGWGSRRGWRRTHRDSRSLTSHSGGFAAAKRQRDINRKRLPILVDNLIEGHDRKLRPMYPLDHFGPGKRCRRIIVCFFTEVLHFNKTQGKILNLGWKKFDIILLHALILDIAVIYRTIGLHPGWLASCGSRLCCQGIGHTSCQSME